LNGPGRPTKKRKEVLATLLASIERGAPYNLSCLAAGVDPTTFNDWRRTDPQFALKVDQAAAKGGLARLKKIEKHGDEDWRSLSWMLSQQFPEYFGRSGNQINVGVGLQTGANSQVSFQMVVVNDADFLRLRDQPNYEHHSDSPVRDIEGEIVPEELSGHLTRAGSPATSMILSQSEADAIEAQASPCREAVAKMFEQYRPRQSGNGSDQSATTKFS
jgi:hypothetical protein